MGLIFSGFRRKKTTTEVLDHLDTQIKSIEQDGENKQLKHKRLLSYVMAYSVGLYMLIAILYYYIYVGRSQNWLNSILHASPLLVLPIIVIFIRSGISWYFNWMLEKNRLKLKKMREDKKNILEQVMNTETYKVAKEILDKYGSSEDQSKALKPFIPTNNVPGNSPSTTPAPAFRPMSPAANQFAGYTTPPLQAFRPISPAANQFAGYTTPPFQAFRPISPAANQFAGYTTPPFQATPGVLRQRQIAIHTSTPKNGSLVPFMNNSSGSSPRLASNLLPRPIPSNNRSALDKVVDYLMKDGPDQRMALICSQCVSHNGMAMVEEFEYISYICPYCGHMNSALKKRPVAPLLFDAEPAHTVEESSTPNSATESEEEAKVQEVPNCSRTLVDTGSGSNIDLNLSMILASTHSEDEKDEESDEKIEDASE